MRDGNNWYIYGNNNPLIIFDPTGLDGEYFQLRYTQKQDYFDIFSGSWWLSPLKAFANIGVFAGNSFIDITNTLTDGVNLILYAGQNPNWNYELMDTIAYGPGKLSDEIVYYFQNTLPEQIIGDLKDSLTDPATYERALANFVIMWVGYKSSVIKNQGNGLEGKNFAFDEVDDFVKESYDELSAEGKKIVGEYVDDAGKFLAPDGKYYSTAYRTKLPNGSYPGGSYAQHFRSANKALLEAMDASSEFAQMMDDLIPGIRNQLVGPRGGISPSSPSGWVWHHNIETGIMDLVPKGQHTTGSIFWDTLHPSGVGGMATWNK